MAANLKNSERRHRGQLRTLPQEITTIRDKIVDRFQDAPLSEIAEFVRKVLAQEKNQINRIAALAARVVLIRNYVNELSGLDPVTSSGRPTSSDIEGEAQNTQPVAVVAELETEVHAGMHRVRLIEDSTVNGVAFPKGVVIDVKEADAKRLIDSGKAEDTVKHAEKASPESPPGDPLPEETTSEEAASEEAASKETTSEEASAEEASAKEGSAEEGSAEEASAEEASAEEASAKEGSAEEGSAKEGSAKEGSAEEASAEEASAEEGSAKEGSAEEASTEEASSEQASANDDETDTDASTNDPKA